MIVKKSVDLISQSKFHNAFFMKRKLVENEQLISKYKWDSRWETVIEENIEDKGKS